MDWNYFFSAFAQSGAAIIGIFGAFIITKVVAEEKGYYDVEFEHQELEDETDHGKRKKHERQLLNHLNSHLKTYKSLLVMIILMMVAVVPLVILPLCYLPTFNIAEPPLRVFRIWNDIWGMRVVLLVLMLAFTEVFFAFALYRLVSIKNKYSLIMGKLNNLLNTTKSPT